MKILRQALTCLAMTFTLLSVPILAQKTTGSISGQITDTTGAQVSGAAVSVTSGTTGYARKTTSNSQGNYSFEEVPNGQYTVTVEGTSFKKFVANNVVVNVATNTRIDAKLAVGTVSETVEVSAAAVQVQTDSGALGTVVDGDQVKELPLNGRSFVQLTQLGPGVSGANNFDSKNKGLQGGVDFSVNGNPTTNNLFLVDGSNDNDVGSNRTILIYPSNESIAEFKMLTNSYGPEYGQASGAVISIATKSGGNDFHGSVFYSGRNDAVAAYSYFAARNAGQGQPLDGKDKLRRNDWGYSIGGPIKKDKLYFFWNQEWNHEIRGYTQSACVPTAAERAGDFSNPVAVHNGQAVMSCNEPQPTFPTAITNGNPHVLKTVDNAGSLLAQYYTLPNKPLNDGGNNWSQSLPSALSWRQENARVDYNLNKSNTIMGRYTQDSWNNPSYNGNQYWGDSPFPTLNGSWSQPSKMAIVRWTDSISSSLVNDAEFAYSNNRINVAAGGTDPTLLTKLSAAIAPLYPQSLKTASASTPTIWGGLGNYGNNNNLWSIAPWNNTLDLYTFRDDVSKVSGRHTIKAGVFMGFDGKNEDTGAASTERPTFSTADWAVDTTKGGIATGNNLANVLIPNNPFTLSETSTNVRAQLRWRDYEFYGADTFKLTPKVTVNFGLRYSFLRNPTQPNNQLTSFQPELYDPSKPSSDACNGLWIAPGTDPCGAANQKYGTAFSHGVAGPNNSLVNNNNHLIAPRLGVAWDVLGNGKTAVRVGAGQFYQRERVSRYTMVANAPFAVSVSNYSRALGGPTPASLSGAGASPAGGMDPRAILPNSWQWNVTVEQTLAKDTVLQTSYVGNRGIHLTSSYDINNIAPANWAAASFTSNQQPLRRFSNDGALTYWSHGGDSSYNSLQMLFRTQYHSFRMQAAYTWSHTIANIQTDDSSGGTGSQSFTYYPNPRLDRGNAATNRPNIFVANGTYAFPTLNGKPAIQKAVLGGWQITGITTADSGNSFTVYQNGISENSALVAANATGAGSLNALFQTGLVSNQRPLIAPNQGGCTSTGIKGNQIINPNAFTLVGYHIGTIEPSMEPRGYCHGPRLVNTDMSFDKTWMVREKIGVQLRLDFFDIFNHANFRADQGNFTAISSVNCGAQIGGKYAPCSVTNNVVTAETRGQNFGTSTGLVGNAGRQMQYGLHVTF